MDRKRLYRPALLLLSLCLCLCPVLFGCAAKPEEAPAASRLPDSLKERTFSTHLTVSVGYWNIQDMVNASEKDEILTWIEETFNITLEPISVNWIDYKERYQVMSATHSLPDLFSNLTISSTDTNDSANLSNLIQTDSIRSLPDDLSLYPNVSEMMSEFDYIRYEDGKHYAFPRLSFQDDILGSSDAAMIVRRDWMEKLGFENPSSLDEFIDLICAFANEDPDGNGIDDTIGYNVNSRAALGKWVMLGIAPECNVYTWIETDDGYIPSYLTENFKKVVAAYHTMYERGGLDPDFCIKKATDAVDDFARGKLGALEYKSSPSALLELQAQWELHQTIPFADAVAVLNIFPADDGNYYSNSSNPFWSETLFSSGVDDEKMDRILSLLEFLLSDEGVYLTRYGIEDVDYTYKNGKFESLLPRDTNKPVTLMEKKYPSLMLFASLATWGGKWMDFEVNDMNLLRFGEDAMKLASESLEWNAAHTITVERPYDFLLMPKEYSDYFSTEQLQDDFASVIIGDGDPIARWESIISRYYENGLEEYIRRQNEQFAEYTENRKQTR